MPKKKYVVRIYSCPKNLKRFLKNFSTISLLSIPNRSLIFLSSKQISKALFQVLCAFFFTNLLFFLLSLCSPLFPLLKRNSFWKWFPLLFEKKNWSKPLFSIELSQAYILYLSSWWSLFSTLSFFSISFLGTIFILWSFLNSCSLSSFTFLWSLFNSGSLLLSLFLRSFSIYSLITHLYFSSYGFLLYANVFSL